MLGQQAPKDQQADTTSRVWAADARYWAPEFLSSDKNSARGDLPYANFIRPTAAPCPVCVTP
jgi:hypothetical protein